MRFGGFGSRGIGADYNQRKDSYDRGVRNFLTYLIEHPHWTLEHRGKYVAVEIDSEGELINAGNWTLNNTPEEVFVHSICTSIGRSRSKAPQAILHLRIGLFMGDDSAAKDITHRLISP